MLAKITSGATVGLEAVPIEVEVDVASRGLPTLSIVGLADKAVQEAKERVRAALQNSDTDYPKRRITINLAPADLPKQGPAYDLPIAIALLLANGELNADLSQAVLFGELSLDGTLRHTYGALPIVLMAKKLGLDAVFLPKDNASEAAIVSGLNIYPVDSLLQLKGHFSNLEPIKPVKPKKLSDLITQTKAEIDMADVAGQEQAKRALEVAAAGMHNLYFKGVPGAGKTMLARAFAGILPRLTSAEALEVTKIYSIAGSLKPSQALITSRPFRSPHHTISRIGLIGGGTNPKPGEISLAHRGILFLDEFPEYPRSVLESLRQPLEDGMVQISRVSQTNTYPCRFSLVAAANPCPCGNYQSPYHPCTCSGSQVVKYQKKISGPLLDRIDIHLNVEAVEIDKLAKFKSRGETSETIQARVQMARDRQLERFTGQSISANGEMSTKQIKEFCRMGKKENDFLTQAAQKLHLTARSFFKTIRVARTIADLGEAEAIGLNHLAEALQYRPGDTG